jgi:hypothetical protein
MQNKGACAEAHESLNYDFHPQNFRARVFVKQLPELSSRIAG